MFLHGKTWIYGAEAEIIYWSVARKALHEYYHQKRIIKSSWTNTFAQIDSLKDKRIFVWFRIWSVIWILVKKVRTYSGRLRICSEAQDARFLIRKLGTLDKRYLWILFLRKSGGSYFQRSTPYSFKIICQAMFRISEIMQMLHCN